MIKIYCVHTCVCLLYTAYAHYILRAPAGGCVYAGNMQVICSVYAGNMLCVPAQVICFVRSLYASLHMIYAMQVISRAGYIQQP